MDGKIIVLGNSHVHMLRQKIADDRFAIHWINFGVGPSARHGDIDFDQGVERASTAQLVAITLLGTEHNSMGLLRHETPFDVMLPGDMDMDAALIPYRTARDMFLEKMRANWPVPKIVAAVDRAVHIATPPPKEVIVWERPEARPPLEALNAPERRLRLWKVEMDALRLRCDELGMEYLPPPEDALTADGFLDPDFAASDALHANKRYGALVLEQLRVISRP